MLLSSGGAGQPAPPASMKRLDLLARLAADRLWDVVIIGGGATGLGVALDATVRGFSVALVDADDFAKGTSSRSTKLVHGGVRYLAQGNIGLVREALHERATLLASAPHLAQPLPFVMPSYRWWEKWFYGAGLVIYDMLAGNAGLANTEFLSRSATLRCSPTTRAAGLYGGVKYWDGQFDDARLAVALARTAVEQGACAVNHCTATRLIASDGAIEGVTVRDNETKREIALRTRCVINAAGVWVDAVRRMDNPDATDIVAPSQGVHVVVDREFLPTDHALLIPRTEDGRVLFAVPWLGRTVLGTTDTPRHDLPVEPVAFDEEIDFILRESGKYLSRRPARADIRSVWVGLRPLVKPPASGANGDAENTKRLSREHTVLVSRRGLVTVTGGKWTTYRAMAEDVLMRCFERGLLPERRSGATGHLQLVGAPAAGAGAPPTPLSAPPGLHLYGTDAALVQTLPGAERDLCPGLSEAMVRFAVRHEFARTVEDVLARRSRLLFLDARLAGTLAQPVAAILAEELGPSFDAPASAHAFAALAARYAAPGT
jgi:glycerol-3-phosphate dehydrogenase